MQNAPSTITASDICDRLGRARLAAALGVGRTAVSNAAVAGRFPASWFMVIAGLCAESGLPCPDAVFAFKPAAQSVADDGAGGSEAVA